MNFDQAIVFFLVLAQYIRSCKSSLFRLHEYGQPIVNFKITFQHQSMLAYKQESHDNKIQTISHHFSPKSSDKSTKPFFQLIQAKSEKSPLCDGAGAGCTLHTAQPSTDSWRWVIATKPRRVPAHHGIRPALSALTHRGSPGVIMVSVGDLSWRYLLQAVDIVFVNMRSYRRSFVIEQ